MIILKGGSHMVSIKKTMDRKEFLFLLWRRLFRPMIILFAFYYSTKFLIAVLREDGSERFLTIVILSLMIFLALLYLIGLIIRKMSDRIYAGLSDTTKFNLRRIGRISYFIVVVITAVILYKTWANNPILVAIYGAMLLFDVMNNLLRWLKK